MINKNDMLIIANLRENARQNLTDMSKKTRVPVSTLFDRIKHTKLISGYTCLVDFELMGYGMQANILIKVDKNQRNDVAGYLEKHRSVNTAYKVNNNFDFMVECIFRNLRELDRFMEELGGKFKIEESEVLYVVEEIKKEKFLCGNSFMETARIDDRKAYKTNLAQKAE